MKTRHKNYVIVTAVLALMVGLVMAAGQRGVLRATQQSTIGYVDVEYLYFAYLQPAIGQRLVDAGLDETLQTELEKFQVELDKELAELEKDQGLSETARLRLAQAIQAEYQQQLDANQRAMCAEVEEKAYGELIEAIHQVAVNEKVDLVLNGQIVLVGGVDLTQQVLNELGIGQ
ncbi:MAG: OmpH family outer membrane protein [Limnochordia bacterium]|jgi:Skp family chaperone for outer membrane proteins|nr:OmpH family outer membrane protein [Limnochordia bacterium]MDD2630303.1 OmpH family outer membrane protein [Limnochordia bacterium]MDD4518134.1 OmpH family outer membrane protein [Limnochordia bacterium]